MPANCFGLEILLALGYYGGARVLRRHSMPLGYYGRERVLRRHSMLLRWLLPALT
jgi:hypothetical protein